MQRSSVQYNGGTASPIVASVDMESNRRISNSQHPILPGAAAGAVLLSNNNGSGAEAKKREITQKDAIKILNKLRPVRRRTFILSLISGILAGYNWFGTYIWTYSTLSSYLDYMLVSQIQQGSIQLYQVPGCSSYVSNNEIANTTFAQIRSYDSTCPYNFCIVDLSDCSLRTDYSYRFPIRFSENTKPSLCSQTSLSSLAAVKCTFTTLSGYTGLVSNSRSLCVFADSAAPSASSSETSVDRLTRYFTNYAKVNTINAQVQVSCQLRSANSTDLQNPLDTSKNAIDYLLLFVLVSVIAGIIVIKELFKTSVLLLSICYAKYRQPGYFILVTSSPIIIPFCFSDFYLALILASNRVSLFILSIEQLIPYYVIND